MTQNESNRLGQTKLVLKVSSLAAKFQSSKLPHGTLKNLRKSEKPSIVHRKIRQVLEDDSPHLQIVLGTIHDLNISDMHRSECGEIWNLAHF